MDGDEEEHPTTNISGINSLASDSGTWQKVVSTKRKHSDDSDDRPRILSRDPRIKHSSFINKNPFQCLANNSQHEIEKEKEVKPPPIFLTSEVSFPDLCNYLNTLVGDNNYKCVSFRKKIKILPATASAYRGIVRALRENNAEFHTFQLSEDRPYRVVIRGLHPSIDTNEIKTSLANEGFEVKAVTNVLSLEKLPLPLFYVDLIRSKKSEEIFSLQFLLQTKITVEEPRKKRGIVQCYKCQNYGHTKNYCQQSPRCVRCGKDHLSSECKQEKSMTASCALCHNNGHPSNYKGCSVYQNLKRLRSTSNNYEKQTVSSRTISRDQPIVTDKTQFPPLRNSRFSRETQQYYNNSKTQTPNNLNKSSHPSAESKMSYSQAAGASHERLSTGQLDIFSQLSSFITEMRNIVTPLISLVSQLMQNLISHNGK
jgi:hypothetical protein